MPAVGLAGLMLRLLSCCWLVLVDSSHVLRGSDSGDSFGRSENVAIPLEDFDSLPDMVDVSLPQHKAQLALMNSVRNHFGMRFIGAVPKKIIKALAPLADAGSEASAHMKKLGDKIGQDRLWDLLRDTGAPAGNHQAMTPAPTKPPARAPPKLQGKASDGNGGATRSVPTSAQGQAEMDLVRAATKFVVGKDGPRKRSAPATTIATSVAMATTAAMTAAATNESMDGCAVLGRAVPTSPAYVATVVTGFYEFKSKNSKKNLKTMMKN